MIPLPKGADELVVSAFQLQRLPITNAEFLAFTERTPEWRRGAAPSVFADSGYLSHWASPRALGSDADPRQPVTRVSWFAATAYCESIGARLPTWHEWELAAAADDARLDARSDPAWRQRILDWYARPGGRALARVGLRAPNAWGVRDLEGLVFEWVLDAGSLLVAGDDRVRGDADLLAYCGSAALDLEQKENYAVLMRIALLTSLPASGTTALLGFRCARDGTEAAK